MPNVNDIYPSKWMRAADLKGAAHQLTIRDVDTGIIGEGDTAKNQIILEFDGDWKPLGLNKTNAQAIGDLFGEDTDDWLDQEIVIFPTRVDFQGKMVDAIRVDGRATQKLLQERLKQSARPAAKAPAKAPAPARTAAKQTAPPLTQAEVDDGDESDIPF